MAETKKQCAQVEAQARLLELLKAHPNVFIDHPIALEWVNLKDKRGALSLLERQVDQLRRKIAQGQATQKEVIQAALDNDKIASSVYAVSKRLIAFRTLEQFTHALPELLRETFNIDAVSCKTQQDIAQNAATQIPYHDCLTRLHNKGAVCDNRWPSAISALFFGEEIQSAALLPLRDEKGVVHGVLALGSMDKSRFTMDLGTQHLERLGEIVSICLMRLHASEQ